MSFRNAFGIYQALKQRLESSSRPLTCVELFDFPEIKKMAPDANRVSDYLGHMYRRGLLSRTNAPKGDNSMARYAYAWKNPKASAPQARVMQPRLVVNNAQPNGELSTGEVKPNVTVSEDGRETTIDLPHITITFKVKR